MSMRGGYDKEVGQIESIAETKGIELDDVVVRETTADDGDDLIVFRILETKGETEKNSVGVQVSKMPSVQTGDMTFRNDVQNKLAALKRHLAGEQESTDDTEDTEEAQESEESTASTDTSDTQRTRTRSASGAGRGGDGPGAEIDARLTEIEDRLDDLEARVETIEEKADALDGLQKLMAGSEDSDD